MSAIGDPPATTASTAASSPGGGDGDGRWHRAPAGLELFGAWRATGRTDLATHVAHHGALPLPRRGDTSWPARLAGVVEAAGLTGRGGAAFPSATKLALVRSQRAGAVVVVNAMEGEPASSKDRALLACAPHLVLDGAELAASALGAARILVCVAHDRPDTAQAVTRAVAERHGTGDAPVGVEVVQPPGRYVSGEESALVSWLGGGAAAPTFRPRKGAALVLRRRAALVHNAETLAHLALIARHGPGAFRAVGLPDAPGTTLVTISGGVARPGVYEIALGTPLRDVIGRAEPTEAVEAVLTGGFGGTWLRAVSLGVPYAPRPMAEVGGVVGAGVLVVLPRSSCGLAETARIATYMAGESAGQCGPCVFGLPAIAADLTALAQGRADRKAVQRLTARLEVVEGRGACRHPDGVVRMARSALNVFAGEVKAHLASGPCPLQRRPSVLPPLAAR